VFAFLRSKPLLDEDSVQWIFDVYDWGLRNLGGDVFCRETRLVLPTPDHFPGRAESVQGMAELVFARVAAHAGMAHWPLRLAAPGQPAAGNLAALSIPGPLRGQQGVADEADAPVEWLSLNYAPGLVNAPEALIGVFAHQLAQLLASQVAEEPPGGRENWPHFTELLGVFMGFGLMLSNTAFKVPRGGCGSCATDNVGRTSYLSQYHLTYALALFAILKGTRNREVLPHLKSPLRPFFKKAVKDIKDRADALEALQALLGPAPTGAVPTDTERRLLG
jgi:hypothetical protein